MRIQEIAEELVNLSAHEVQELSMLMNKNDGELPIPIARPELKNYEVMSPKEYGMKLINTRKRQKR
jgi:hypothetical protein